MLGCARRGVLDFGRMLGDCLELIIGHLWCFILDFFLFERGGRCTWVSPGLKR
jgi:hypothetical protein